MSARPLPAVPPPTCAALAATRERLHRLAEDVLAPARVAATGNEIALEPRPGGFGTPPFPGGGEVRVEGVELVRVGTDGAEAREPVDADPGAAALLAAWFAFAGELLATLRARGRPRRRRLRGRPVARALRRRRRGRPRGPARDLRRLPGRRAAPAALPLRRAVGGPAGRVGRGRLGRRGLPRRGARLRRAGRGRRSARRGAGLPARPARGAGRRAGGLDRDAPEGEPALELGLDRQARCPPAP